MKPQGVILFETRLIEAAKAQLERNDEGAFDEDKLVDEVAKIVPFDLDAARRAKAQRIVDDAKRPGSTKPKGQLLLPGFNVAYIYEPNRLVADDSGHVVENYRALPAYKSADTRRAEENVDRATEQLRRKTAEERLHSAWALAQALLGRPALELTWGNCVEESGFRQADDDEAVA